MHSTKNYHHTIVLSDIHLADAEPPHPGNPLWKRYKRPKYFIDESFKKFLETVTQKIQDRPIELVLNGDIFDFDSVMPIPDKPYFSVNWVEKMRGLFAEEQKSKFKINIILRDHSVWVEAIRDFILKGNKVVFVIGNHDVELHWPSVQETIVRSLKLSAEFNDAVNFCEWFYISDQDTLIEHSNQYDPYCICFNPINPLIKKGNRVLIRIPFGNMAGKIMLNGMGLMNPHVDTSYIKASFFEYIVFFFKYVIRVQPLLVWTWFWGAFVTLFYSIEEGLLPALSDPLTIEDRVDKIAEKSNATPRIVRSLRALHVHPAIFNPIRVLRELWLDRALLFLFVVFLAFEFYTFINVFYTVSVWWFIVPLSIMLPFFIFYAKSIQSEVLKIKKIIFKNVPLSAEISGVKRVIHGHTHEQCHTWIEGIEFLNTGTWSPAFHDVECREPFGKKYFAWLRPKENNSGRLAGLYEWTGEDFKEILPESS